MLQLWRGLAGVATVPSPAKFEVASLFAGATKGELGAWQQAFPKTLSECVELKLLLAILVVEKRWHVIPYVPPPTPLPPQVVKCFLLPK